MNTANLPNVRAALNVLNGVRPRSIRQPKPIVRTPEQQAAADKVVSDLHSRMATIKASKP